MAKTIMLKRRDLASDASVFVQDVIHKDVVVKTTNKEMLEAIQSFRDQLRQDGKAAVMHTFRSISKAIRDKDTDTVYKGQQSGDKHAVMAWRDLCMDVILLAACRHVLWKKPVPIQPWGLSVT